MEIFILFEFGEIALVRLVIFSGQSVCLFVACADTRRACVWPAFPLFFLMITVDALNEQVTKTLLSMSKFSLITQETKICV